MTVQEAVRWIDEKKHNVYSLEDKLFWLSQVEWMAQELELRFGADSGIVALEADSGLRIPAPYDQLYLRWLEAQIDYTNQEYLKYNNAMAQFNTLWGEFANRYCREHLHRYTGFRLDGRGGR